MHKPGTKLSAEDPGAKQCVIPMKQAVWALAVSSISIIVLCQAEVSSRRFVRL